MSKIKKRMLGLVLGMCLFGGSAGSCYAAPRIASQIVVDITADKAYGKFEYGEAGHQIQVLVDFVEVEISTGKARDGRVADVQNGNVTTAVVVRKSPDGYRYRWGIAYGYVDGVFMAQSAAVSVN